MAKDKKSHDRNRQQKKLRRMRKTREFRSAVNSEVAKRTQNTKRLRKNSPEYMLQEFYDNTAAVRKGYDIITKAVTELEKTIDAAQKDRPGIGLKPLEVCKEARELISTKIKKLNALVVKVSECEDTIKRFELLTDSVPEIEVIVNTIVSLQIQMDEVKDYVQKALAEKAEEFNLSNEMDYVDFKDFENTIHTIKTMSELSDTLAEQQEDADLTEILSAYQATEGQDDVAHSYTCECIDGCDEELCGCGGKTV